MFPIIRKGTRIEPLGRPYLRIAQRPTTTQSGNQTTP